MGASLGWTENQARANSLTEAHSLMRATISIFCLEFVPYLIHLLPLARQVCLNCSLERSPWFLSTFQKWSRLSAVSPAVSPEGLGTAISRQF